MSKEIKVVRKVHPALMVNQMGGADIGSVGRAVKQGNYNKALSESQKLKVRQDPNFWQQLQEIKPVSTVDQYLGDAIKMGLDYALPGSSGVYDVGVNIGKQLGLGRKKKKPGPKKGSKKKKSK